MQKESLRNTQGVLIPIIPEIKRESDFRRFFKGIAFEQKRILMKLPVSRLLIYALSDSTPINPILT